MRWAGNPLHSVRAANIPPPASHGISWRWGPRTRVHHPKVTDAAKRPPRGRETMGRLRRRCGPRRDGSHVPRRRQPLHECKSWGRVRKWAHWWRSRAPAVVGRQSAIAAMAVIYCVASLFHRNADRMRAVGTVRRCVLRVAYVLSHYSRHERGGYVYMSDTCRHRPCAFVSCLYKRRPRTQA